MIHSLRGKVLNLTENQLCLSSGFINFELFVPRPEMFAIGKEVDVHVYMHWNQEQGPSLFGFSSLAEKKVFLLVIGCSGIGPKIGLSVLAQLSPAEFVRAVQAQDIKVISSVNGIGAKKAEQIALQLKHNIDKVIDFVASENSSVDLHGIRQLREVLVSLNYSNTEINSAIEYARSNTGTSNFDNLLRKALGFLSKSI